MGSSQTEEIGLGLMERGGLLVMISGFNTIVGAVLGIIVESRVWGFLFVLASVLGIGGIFMGLTVWGIGWMMKED